MNTNNEFEAILRDALAEYRDAEPLTGLEARILRRVQGPQRRAWWGWSIAAGLAMALLAVAAWFELRDPPYRPVSTYQASADRPVFGQAPPMAHTRGGPADLPQFTPKSSDHLPRRTVAAQTPRATVVPPSVREEFPASSPMTSEERALLALANTDPDALRTLPGNEKELAIAPITIQPLAGGNEGEN